MLITERRLKICFCVSHRTHATPAFTPMSINLPFNSKIVESIRNLCNFIRWICRRIFPVWSRDEKWFSTFPMKNRVKTEDALWAEKKMFFCIDEESFERLFFSLSDALASKCSVFCSCKRLQSVALDFEKKFYANVASRISQHEKLAISLFQINLWIDVYVQLRRPIHYWSQLVLLIFSIMT